MIMGWGVNVKLVGYYRTSRPHFSVLPFPLSRQFPDDMSSEPKFSAKRRRRSQVARCDGFFTFTGLDYNHKPVQLECVRLRRL